MTVRRKARGLTTLIAGVVSLGLMTGTATAGVGAPGVPDVGGVGVEVQGTVPRACVSLGLSSSCGDIADPAQIVNLAQVVAAACLASDGTCTAAVGTARGAIDAAKSCIDAMASSLGVSPRVTAALGVAQLDCGEVVDLMVGLAEFTMQVVNNCTFENDATCRTVFAAARAGVARAAGCLSAVLPGVSLSTSGVDPDCAEAMAMLYREAEGLVALLTGCLNGTAVACDAAREYAQFAAEGLTGCSGDLFVYFTDVPRPFPAGPLPCYAVLDQVNVAINALLGEVPALPTTITPTNDEDCSITVAIPIFYVDPTDPESSQTVQSPHDAQGFVPACYEPEWIGQLTDTTTPSPTGGIESLGAGVETPECENATPSEDYIIDRTNGDFKDDLVHKVFVNYNGTVLHTEYEVEVDKTWTAKITAGAETELKTWIGKVKAHVEAEVSYSRTAKETIRIKPDIPPHTEYHVARKLYAKVVEGRHYQKFEDCTVRVQNRRVKAPYYDTWFKWEEPYNGDHP